MTRPLDTRDPFALLGLERRHDLDRRTIETAHLRRVALLHPDRIADPIRREELQHEVAALNEARELLLDHERRSDRLLTLLGGPSREEDRTLPEGFLVEIMELQEALESALAGSDAAARSAVEGETLERRRRHREQVASLFNAWGAEPDPALLRRIRLELNAWRYIERLREALKP